MKKELVDKTEVVNIGGVNVVVSLVSEDMTNVNKVMTKIKALSSGSLKYSEEDTEKGEEITVSGSTVTVAPWGQNNNFPKELGDLVYDSTIVGSLNEFKVDQIWGDGPVLVDSDGNYTKDKEIMAWLDKWEWKEYLMALAADFVFSGNCFSCASLTKGSHTDIVKEKIAFLYHLHNKDVRLEVKDKNGALNNVVVGDWTCHVEGGNGKDIKFDKWALYKGQKSLTNERVVFFCKRPLANFSYYTYPSYRAVLEYWIPIAQKIAEMHLALLDNSIHAKWHIQISLEYIERLYNDKLKGAGENAKNITLLSVYESYVQEITEKLKKVMVGSENAGKFFASPIGKNNDGEEIEYVRITSIDLKVKEVSESYLKLYEQVISSITSALSVDPALASVVSGSKMNSGSEMLNSHNIHQQVKTKIPREVILKPINEAIRLNFPSKDIRVVFKPIFLVKTETNKTGVNNE